MVIVAMVACKKIMGTTTNASMEMTTVDTLLRLKKDTKIVGSKIQVPSKNSFLGVTQRVLLESTIVEVVQKVTR